MERFRSFFVIVLPVLLFSGLSGRTVAQDAPAPVPSPQKWALLIGIDEYKDRNHINRLGGASADARSLARTLHEVAGFPDDEHIQLLVSDGETKPTRTEILDAISRLAKNAKDGDMVFVLFAGHGIEIDGRSYLFSYDTSASDDQTIVDTALEADKFRQRLRKVRAAVKLFCFDMCRTDPRGRGRDGAVVDNRLSRAMARQLAPTEEPKSPGKKSAFDRSLQVDATLMACSEGQRSYEWQDKGRGYFSYFLEQGLRGAAADVNGIITIDGIKDYVTRQVAETVQQREGMSQIPLPTITGYGRTVFNRVTPVEPEAKAVPVNVTARLSIVPNVKAATVKVNGVVVSSGKYEIDLPDTETAAIRVSVTAPGYRANVQDVTVARGQTLRLPIALTRSTPDRVAVVKGTFPTPLDKKRLAIPIAESYVAHAPRRTDAAESLVTIAPESRDQATGRARMGEQVRPVDGSVVWNGLKVNLSEELVQEDGQAASTDRFLRDYQERYYKSFRGTNGGATGRRVSSSKAEIIGVPVYGVPSGAVRANVAVAAPPPITAKKRSDPVMDESDEIVTDKAVTQSPARATSKPSWDPPNFTYSGVVEMRVTINADGSHTEEFTKNTGVGELDRYLKDFFSRWRWEPGKIDGKAVKTSKTVRFRID